MPEEEEFRGLDFSELFIHQLIEIIEFILGSISNTASYLRLWALSLAHEALSKVFYTMIMKNSISSGESIGGCLLILILGTQFFVIMTIAIIIMMDTMEAILHALRLHWVEF